MEDEFEDIEKDGYKIREEKFKKTSEEIMKELDLLKDSLKSHKSYVIIKLIIYLTIYLINT